MEYAVVTGAGGAGGCASSGAAGGARGRPGRRRACSGGGVRVLTTLPRPGRLFYIVCVLLIPDTVQCVHKKTVVGDLGI